MSGHFLEIDYFQLQKNNQRVHGDVFISRKHEGRTVSVLADGLGSGIKANVLATLTTTMATRFIVSDIDIRKAARVILETLPICSRRKIGYSTFTIVDAALNGDTRIIEHDNPGYVLLRNGQALPVEKSIIQLENGGRVRFSLLTLVPGDRIVFFSDGVSQAGLGMPHLPLGWKEEGVITFLEEQLRLEPHISAGDLSRKVTRRAHELDAFKAADDITCAALYYRKPRKTLLMTGPPYNIENDRELARIAREFEGSKIVCGGTTASILSRELDLPISVNLNELKHGNTLPPSATMPGFDLITEGTITLSRCLGVLEEDPGFETLPDDVIRKLIRILINSDIVECLVGTRINEAHQDPNLPKELEIRRNMMKKFCEVLETKYMKETRLQFI